jgi:hypothetical protein
VLGGDIILRIDNKTVSTINDIPLYLDTKRVGDTVQLAISRENATKNISLTLAVPAQREIIREERNADMTLLSDRYLNEEFGNKIIGEVMNNGTARAEFVQVSVSFYDLNHQIIGNEYSYANPSTIEPGQRSPFTVLISDDSIIPRQTAYYEIILQWRNTTDGSDYSRRYPLPG